MVNRDMGRHDGLSYIQWVCKNRTDRGGVTLGHGEWETQAHNVNTVSRDDHCALRRRVERLEAALGL